MFQNAKGVSIFLNNGASYQIYSRSRGGVTGAADCKSVIQTTPGMPVGTTATPSVSP